MCGALGHYFISQILFFPWKPLTALFSVFDLNKKIEVKSQKYYTEVWVMGWLNNSNEQLITASIDQAGGRNEKSELFREQ